MATALLASTALGCTSVGFRNSELYRDHETRRVYLPAVVDDTPWSGQSLRLSAALRRRLLNDSRVQLEPLDQARWSLDVHILKRTHEVIKVDDCVNTPAGTVGNGGFSCADSKLAYSRPEVSPRREAVALQVRLKVVDLNTGALVYQRTWTPGVDAATRAEFTPIADLDNLSAKPAPKVAELHGLRYAEDVDQAIEIISSQLADTIVAELQSLPYTTQ